MTKNKQPGYLAEDIRVKYHKPEKSFMQKAENIVDTLMRGAKNNAHLALNRLNFFISKAGKDLAESKELVKAKELLENLINKQKH